MSACVNQRGLTLIEVLVALAIVSIALVAGMRSLAQGTTGMHALETRNLALQAIQNRLAQLYLERAFPPPGQTTVACSQGSLVFVCEQQIASTGNVSFRAVTIQARLADGPVLARMSGVLSPLP